ncbi:MAG: DUF2953 domain-containing protein, partial [Hyphomonadaceae bacterium]|nr:DUF2953 domain-containing protein [Clostridia bacterium]
DKTADKKEAGISVRIFGLRFTLPVPEKVKKAVQDEISPPDKQLEGFIAQGKHFLSVFEQHKGGVKHAFAYLKKHLRMRTLIFELHYGTGDAAYTGVSYGLIWAVLGNVYAQLDRLLIIQHPKITIKPDFQNLRFEIQAQCIISFRLIHIIIAYIMYQQAMPAIKSHEQNT